MSTIVRCNAVILIFCSFEEVTIDGTSGRTRILLIECQNCLCVNCHFLSVALRLMPSHRSPTIYVSRLNHSRFFHFIFVCRFFGSLWSLVFITFFHSLSLASRLWIFGLFFVKFFELASADEHKIPKRIKK